MFFPAAITMLQCPITEEKVDLAAGRVNVNMDMGDVFTYSDMCYHFFNSKPDTYENAQMYCARRSGSLVWGTSPAFQVWFAGFRPSHFPVSCFFPAANDNFLRFSRRLSAGRWPIGTTGSRRKTRITGWAPCAVRGPTGSGCGWKEVSQSRKTWPRAFQSNELNWLAIVLISQSDSGLFRTEVFPIKIFFTHWLVRWSDSRAIMPCICIAIHRNVWYNNSFNIFVLLNQANEDELRPSYTESLLVVWQILFLKLDLPSNDKRFVSNSVCGTTVSSFELPYFFKEWRSLNN